MADEPKVRRRALIPVDMLIGFGPLPDGELPVEGAMELVPIVNELMELKEYDDVVAPKESHPPNHCSFVEFGGIWPKHCVVYTRGWMFLPGLNTKKIKYVVCKATRPDKEAYSGFEDTDMDQRLTDQGITDIDVCGLATDYCDLATALDGVARGYKVRFLKFASRAVAPNTEAEALEKMRAAGIEIIEKREDLTF